MVHSSFRRRAQAATRRAWWRASAVRALWFVATVALVGGAWLAMLATGGRGGVRSGSDVCQVVRLGPTVACLVLFYTADRGLYSVGAWRCDVAVV